MFVGVKVQSNELIIIDQDTEEVKRVRTVRRVFEEQRWSSDNLVWVQSVPWNAGRGDTEAMGTSRSSKSSTARGGDSPRVKWRRS